VIHSSDFSPNTGGCLEQPTRRKTIAYIPKLTIIKGRVRGSQHAHPDQNTYTISDIKVRKKLKLLLVAFNIVVAMIHINPLSTNNRINHI